MDAVPAARRGRLGIHLHKYQAPTDWTSGLAMAPQTSAQYPHPTQASNIARATEIAPERTSMAEVTEKWRARFSSARCRTEVPLMNIVSDIPTATCATRWSPYNFASIDPAEAKPIANRRLTPTLIQNRLLARK